MCGENTLRSISSVVFFGSSPRVRGKQILGFKDSSQKGLIPACAGKTLYLREIGGRGRAHPRVCGENRSIAAKISSLGGSSPRVRGKQKQVAEYLATHGLIPACAGKTKRLSAWHSSNRAHPRVCGENGHAAAARRMSKGSSPRVRGKPTVFIAVPSCIRLIPACAGKTNRLLP